MPRLTDQQVLEGLGTLPGWSGAGDAIRKEIADRGVELEDTPQGTRWKRRT